MSKEAKTIEEIVDEHLQECTEEKRHLCSAIETNTKATKENDVRLTSLETKVNIILEGAPAEGNKPEIVGLREVSKIFITGERILKWLGAVVTTLLVGILGSIIYAEIMIEDDNTKVIELLQQLHEDNVNEKEG